ncbi:MAG: hypothetical protein OEV42_11300 [Deltaproteobacteria bacterium]|nr:hypothetical protein [Deltaproteobacteria bacterium]
MNRNKYSPLWLLLVAALIMPDPLPSYAAQGNAGKECVIILHGLARTKFSMRAMERAFQERGYKTVNRGYPSTSKSIGEIASEEVPAAVESCTKVLSEKIHFVTHSMGGIIVRYYLQNQGLPEGSRVVMLAPPNQGSELADKMKDLLPYQWLNGPAGQELGTGPLSTPNRLKPVDIEVGVIAGKSSLNPLYSSMIPGDDDGKVAVEKAKLEEMTDFLVVPNSHSFMMNDAEVIRQAVHFIERGRFDPAGVPVDDVSIAPFRSDGCTLFPDGTMKNQNLWCDCCLQHDIAYWRGGREEERLKADETLRDCVKAKTGNRELAELMYRGVRLGGSPVFLTWYRWGYGWPYGRGYEPLSERELESIKERLSEYRQGGHPYRCSD